MKNSSDTSGIEAASFRFVAQYLDHCANAVPYLTNFGHRNRQIMKQAYEHGVGINRTYIQPVVSKSPTTKEVYIDDVEVLPDLLTEQGFCKSFYVLQRNTQTTIIDTLLYMHNPSRKKGGFSCSAWKFFSVLWF